MQNLRKQINAIKYITNKKPLCKEFLVGLENERQTYRCKLLDDNGPVPILLKQFIGATGTLLPSIKGL
jgi:hypothetical protein